MVLQKKALEFQAYATGGTVKPTVNVNGTLESIIINPQLGALTGGSTPAFVATAKAIMLTRLALKIGKTIIFDADAHMLRQLQAIFGKGEPPTNGVGWNPPKGFGIPMSGVNPILEATFNTTANLTTGSPTGFGDTGFEPVVGLSDIPPKGAFSAVQRDIVFAGAGKDQPIITRGQGNLIGILIYDTVGMSNISKLDLIRDGVIHDVTLSGLQVMEDYENNFGHVLESLYYGYMDLSDLTLNGLDLSKAKSLELEITALAASTFSFIPIKVSG